MAEVVLLDAIKTYGRPSDVLVAQFADHLNVRRNDDPLVKW